VVSEAWSEVGLEWLVPAVVVTGIAKKSVRMQSSKRGVFFFERWTVSHNNK
jgi:hypothetical protein